jgi:NAD(P)-dependent dehydrogenase (short-subunit alcohol dehydrogenase family)
VNLEPGQVAVVTGAARGIGLALAHRLARVGLHLVVADRDADELEAVIGALEAHGTDVLAVPTDVSESDAVDRLAAVTCERFGTAHVVCNNAGVGGWAGASWEQPVDAWDWVLRVNVLGVVNGIRAFTPMLVDQDVGHIVNTASLTGMAPVPFLGPYSVSKHAVVAISGVLHHELALTGSAVGVTVLCPGFTRTGIMSPANYWPDERGEVPGHAADPRTAFVRELVETGVDNGLDPLDVAQLALDAIRDRRFLVTTDPAAVERALDSNRATAAGAPPASLALT